MIPRTLAVFLQRAAQKRQPLILEGPRGAGKTTLLRHEFPRYRYVTLEDSSYRQAAQQNPTQFLARLRTPTIIDDVHRVPSLLTSLPIGPKPIIFASSRKLHSTLTTLWLYPPTQAELQKRMAIKLDLLGRFPSALYVTRPSPTSFISAVGLSERDVRDLVSVHDLDRFESFYSLALQHSGESLNQQEIARLAGVSRSTAIRWLGILDACFLTLFIPAYPGTFGRRIVKAPKLHFLDSLAFESRVVWELYRNAMNTGVLPELYYWRDSNGLGIALVLRLESGAIPVPIAVAEKANSIVEMRLRSWMRLADVRNGAIITSQLWGEAKRDGVCWYNFSQL